MTVTRELAAVEPNLLAQHTKGTSAPDDRVAIGRDDHLDDDQLILLGDSATTDHAAPPQLPVRVYSAAQLLPRLQAKFASRITHAITLPARTAQFADIPMALDPALQFALASRGITQLYRHQRQAWDAISSGANVVIATPTASGKTLCFNLPVLDAIRKQSAKAMYLFPTKALAQDQVAELIELNQAGNLGVRAFTFDGDTPSDARAAVRSKGDVVVTNPDMLHQAILPHHGKWAQFFRSLQFIVIDEVHSYRGVFGSHVANVLRRLDRILKFYGANPQFILCSATIGNPQAHAEKLTARSMTLIDQSGAPTGPKHLLFWNPPVINPDLGIRASARSQSTRIARLAIKAGLKTVVFAGSRLMVEVITKYLKDVFDADPRKPHRIRGYRGGYLPNERRDTEQALRAGLIDGVVSTSALELGVDIGSLDVCILNGYPGSIAATWQRLGRAGRRQQAALGVLVASSEALDQYIVQNPEFFLGASPELARIAPDQLLILFDHIRCAAFELPFTDDEIYGGQSPVPMLQILAEEKLLHRSGAIDQGIWHWIDDSYPANAVNLRAVADGNFVVIDTSFGAQKIIAEVDYSAAALTLYEGAIYMVQSAPYQVEKLDWPGRKAFVKQTKADYYTDAIDYTRLKTLAEFDRKETNLGQTYWGEVHVIRRVPGYKKIRYYSHENIGYGQIQLPDHELHTTAVIWTLTAAVIDLHFADRFAALDGFLGAAYALHTSATVRAMSELHDLGKAVGNADASWAYAPQTQQRGRLRGEGLAAESAEALVLGPQFAPTLYLYDQYPGGMGLSETLFQDAQILLQAAYQLVSRCACLRGCPACIGPALATSLETAQPCDQPPVATKPSALTILQMLGANITVGQS